MRLILAEDDVLLREGITRILTEEGHELLGAADDLPSLLQQARSQRPDLVITDIRMPPSFTDEGLVGARLLREEFPGLPVLVLSQYTEPEGAVALLTTGAEGIGYLLKRRIMNLDQFLQSVDVVGAGGTSIDPEVITAMVRRDINSNRDAAVARLTPRRREVLELMAQGFSNARIARQLDVTEKAIARTITLIFETLDLPPNPDDHRRVLAVVRYLNR